MGIKESKTEGVGQTYAMQDGHQIQYYYAWVQTPNGEHWCGPCVKSELVAQTHLPRLVQARDSFVQAIGWKEASND